MGRFISFLEINLSFFNQVINIRKNIPLYFTIFFISIGIVLLAVVSYTSIVCCNLYDYVFCLLSHLLSGFFSDG